MPTPTRDPACADLPPNQNMTISPYCIPISQTPLRIVAGPGFTPGGRVDVCILFPNAVACSWDDNFLADADGYARSNYRFGTQVTDPPGIYTVKITDRQTGFEAVGYYMIHR